MLKKSKIAFVYEHKREVPWEDGLRAALDLLSLEFDITYFNLAHGRVEGEFDLVLGWGAFNSPADKVIRFDLVNARKKALCIAGNAFEPDDGYDLLFYETNWYAPKVKKYNAYKAFGTNTDIYKSLNLEKVFDYISVGTFSSWKRQVLINQKEGNRLVIGEIQRENMGESMGIINSLLLNGVMVSDMVTPKELAKFYNLSETCYIPSTVMGGGERAVLEARACGCKVEIENDNPKLKELLDCPIPDHHLYAKQLKEGICSVL
ncbi:hypothetical protein KO465_09075 [Candidatus Micrarchaeota archaeon]|jgi:hypothetical protein|nr:hypothetical protein [Candidatus Micrarchaeota archaeon]